MKGASLELSIMLMKMRLDDRDDSTGKEKKNTPHYPSQALAF